MNKNEPILLQKKQMFTEMLRKTSAEEVMKTCRRISIRTLTTAEMYGAIPYECVDCEDCCYQPPVDHGDCSNIVEDKHE